MQISIFFDPDCRNGRIAGFDKVVETKHAVVNFYLPTLDEDHNVVHFVEGHSVDKFALKLFDVFVVLEDVEDVFVLHQFLLQVIVGVPTMREFDACYLALMVILWQFDVDTNSTTRKQHNSDLI
jgi:hypothetical protein